jgi:tRNA(Arg) A34 adenosine deaminase TadA
MEQQKICHLSHKHRNLLQTATLCALDSPMCMKIGAVAEQNGDILAKGCNNYRTTVSKQHFCSQHAEIFVLCDILRGTHQNRWGKNDKAPYNSKVKKRKKNRCQRRQRWSIYVVRLRHDGTFGNARPCKDCVMALKCAGVRRVYYTTDEQTLIRENVKDMCSSHLSIFQQKYNEVHKRSNIWYF